MDIEIYKKIIFVSGTMIFFQGARDFILLDKNLQDSDESIQEYAEKLSSFIVSGGLGHDIKETDALRLSQLGILCSKEIQSLKAPCKFFTAIGNVVRRVGFSKTTIEELAKELGLDALVEAHDEYEVDRALNLDAEIVGVNNRDLRTFQIDMNNSIRLRKMAPDNVVFVSESGIRTPDDIRLLYENQVDAVLIGETLMRSPDKKAVLESLNGSPLR